jgi:FkbM family methyltransferase
MNIQKYKFSLNNIDLLFNMPENDNCAPGTIQGLRKNEWKLDQVDFKENDIFVDIGCNIGILSMFVAKKFPFVKIYAFDANPIAINCLQESCLDNNITNIKAYNLAIGAENRVVEFVSYTENETCTVQKEISNPRDVNYKTQMILPEYLFDNIIKSNVKYLKCDIEGGEFQLFDYIFEKVPDLLNKIEYLHLEIHPFDDSNPPTKRLKQLVENKFKSKVLY